MSVSAAGRFGRGELVGEAPPGRDHLLGEVGHAVHVVAQRDAVPVNGEVGGEVVDDPGADQVAGDGDEGDEYEGYDESGPHGGLPDDEWSSPTFAPADVGQPSFQ